MIINEKFPHAPFKFKAFYFRDSFFGKAEEQFVIEVMTTVETYVSQGWSIELEYFFQPLFGG